MHIFSFGLFLQVKICLLPLGFAAGTIPRSINLSDNRQFSCLLLLLHYTSSITSCHVLVIQWSMENCIFRDKEALV